MIQTKKKKIERNIGLEILRMLLCFWVVLFHSINHSNDFILNYIVKKKFHVPCFFFISFYYFFPIIKDRNSTKMKLRLERLSLPYFIWPVFIWFINNILFFIFKTNRFGRILSFKELNIQIITGRLFFIQLWFIFNLLFLSILFFILSFLPVNLFLIFSNFLSIIFYLIQYFSTNYIFYSQFKDCIAHSVGHLIISFPIAITAFSLNRINLINYLEIYRYRAFFSILIIIPLIFFFGSPFTYLGFDKNIFSLFIFYLFNLIPLNKYLNNTLKKIIYLITGFTQGIYCLHIIIKFYLFRFFKFYPTFSSCILLYIICYILSFFGYKIFMKNNLKYLFI